MRAIVFIVVVGVPLTLIGIVKHSFATMDADALKEKYNLTEADYTKGLEAYGSLPDYKGALEAHMTVVAWAEKKQKQAEWQVHVKSCQADWHNCKNNSEIVNNSGLWEKISDDCRRSANESAKYGNPEWPISPFGRYEGDDEYVTTGIAVAIEHNALFENGFGGKGRSTVTCHYDLRSKTVTDVQVSAM